MFVEGLGGGAPAEDLAGSGVQRVGDGLEFLGAPARYVGALREVLAQKAVGVLVGAPLPRAVRVSEEHGDTGLDREPGVLGQFLATVPCQGTAELLGQRGDGGSERVLHR